MHCLPLLWSWFPKAGRNCCFPGRSKGKMQILKDTHRETHTHTGAEPVSQKKEENGKRSFSGAHKLRVQWPRCEITSGIRTRCSGRETAKKKKDFQWKPKRRGGGGDSGERESRISSLNAPCGTLRARKTLDLQVMQTEWIAIKDARWNHAAQTLIQNSRGIQVHKIFV